MRKTFATAAALAALILAPLPLAAQGVKGADRPVASRTGACTDEERTVIRRAFGDARQMTNASIAALTFEPERIRVAYECNRADACGGQTFAYVRWGGNAREVMGFCAAFFRADRTGQDNQGGIVVHEMSHLALGTRDHAYQPRGAQALAKEDPLAAQMNADSYEYFAEFLPR